MMKSIVLCADDYGQASAVSRGILSLLEKERLSAVSCMVNQPQWRESAAEIKPFYNKADVGLHLNLTTGAPLSSVYRDKISPIFSPLSLVLMRSLCRVLRWQRSALLAEIHAQLDAFAEEVGQLPQFIDGHQHIHHLPVIRDALLQVYGARLSGRGTYMRTVTLPRIHNLKAAVIHYTGGRDFAAILTALGIPHNSSFSGIYDFSQAGQYRHRFQSFLAESSNRGLIMCHPGMAGADEQDPIGRARVLEYQYFSSNDFLADCRAASVSISRFSTHP